MEWGNWVKDLGEKYRLDEDDFDFLRAAGVVRFDYDSKGYVSGTWHGKPVYRDSNHELDISPGDIWIVSLSLNNKTGANYFAKPLEKVDASFLYDMKKDQIDAFAEVLWEKNRDILEPYLDEKYSDVVAGRISEGVREQTEAARAEVENLRKEIEDLKRVREEDEKIIKSKDKEIALLSARVLVYENDGSAPRPAPQPEPQRPPAGFVEVPVQKNITVIRCGPDSIRSEGFKKSRYFVHLSADHKSLLVREDKNGNVLCLDGIMVLEGLNSVMPFTEEHELPSEYNARYGGILVHLG